MHQDEVKVEVSQDPELIYIGNFQYEKLQRNRTKEITPSDRARITLVFLLVLK